MLYKKSSGGRRFVVSSAEQDDRKVREGFSWKTYCSVAKVSSPVLQCFQSRNLFADRTCSILAHNGKVHAHRMRMDHDQVLEADFQSHMDVRSNLPG
jgi:hypothetical protein